jgi:hypothetical protein
MPKVKSNGASNGATSLVVVPRVRTKPRRPVGAPGSGRRRAVPFIPDPSRVPWDRQPDETDKAWAAFVIYRDLGSIRTVARTTKELGKRNPQHVEDWSRKYGWRFRVEEYDRDQDRKAREEAERIRLAEVERQTKEMLTVTRSMWVLAGEGLRFWLERIEALRKSAEAGETIDGEPPLSPADIKNLADAGMKLQRLLEEKPTEIGEQRAQITVEDRRRRLQRGLGDPEVRDAMRLVAKKIGTVDAGG